MNPQVSSANRPLSSLTPAVFIALSSGLTGMSATVLWSATEQTDFAQLFHAAILESVPADILNRLAQTFLTANTVAEGAAEVLIDPQLGPVGRSIVRLWLTGVWHDPVTPSLPPRVVGDTAYRQSHVWRIMQAHPMNDHRFGTGHSPS